MSCEEEVIKIGKKLEKMITADTAEQANALDILKALKKLPMTLDILQKTRIGMITNNFRKACKNEEVVSLAKTLIKGWKKLLPEQSSQSQSQSLNRSNSTLSTSSEPAEDNDHGDEQKKKEPRPNTPPQQTTFPAKATTTTDSVRLKCREMLAAALKSAENLEGAVAEPVDIAASVEECIFTEFKNTESKYKNRVRSRVANLKDKRNPQLRENVLLGQISPDRLAVMTAEEMANDKMKELRKQYTKEAIDDHQMATTSGTQTDLLKCGKCGKRNCTYNQVQTRSADEPMTTFVYCNECGNRWKFC